MRQHKVKEEVQELDLSEFEITSLKKHLKKAKWKMMLIPTALLAIYAFMFALPDKKGISLYNTYGLHNMLFWLFLITGIIALILFRNLKILELKKDIKEKKKLIQYGIVSRVGNYKGENYIKLESGKPNRLTSRTHEFYHLNKGTKIHYEVFKNAKILIRIIK
ncbi:MULTISPECIES: hypothetical protein [Cellulophaga]|uniref:hypothetical protein n=1 Tax=Cellulophaga TaxID=104264 RepID=UPI000400048D|nr:hypothetical protein [Cellulophaga baltica]MBA6316228.1 hypothetical protein [Cellulophaga baltica]